MVSMATPNPNGTSPKTEDTRWTDEGGSNQHYRGSDEVAGEPDWKPFGPGEDRSWQKFEATYGNRFAASVKPAEEKIPGKK
jgi:hypothetical protein